MKLIKSAASPRIRTIYPSSLVKYPRTDPSKTTSRLEILMKHTTTRQLTGRHAIIFLLLNTPTKFNRTMYTCLYLTLALRPPTLLIHMKFTCRRPARMRQQRTLRNPLHRSCRQTRSTAHNPLIRCVMPCRSLFRHLARLQRSLGREDIVAPLS